jgi:glutathione synthase/RimK-type ligase-like ATP-grasp enzyme
MRIALVTALDVLRGRLDEDMAPLRAALPEAEEAAWDDPAVDWSRYALAVVRSTWGYMDRLPAFLDWIDRASRAVRLLNPPEVLRRNTDKRYLREFEQAGIPIVPTHVLEPGQDVEIPFDGEVVVKPAVGAGSIGVSRHAEPAAAADAARRLLAAGRTALVQPYLGDVDRDGETGLVFIEGRFSHAIRKGPMLRPAAERVGGLFVKEDIARREPSAAERALAERVLAAAGPALLYARVDLAPGPRLLEFEATEPSLFLSTAPGSAARLAEAIRRRAHLPS